MLLLAVSFLGPFVFSINDRDYVFPEVTVPNAFLFCDISSCLRFARIVLLAFRSLDLSRPLFLHHPPLLGGPSNDRPHYRVVGPQRSAAKGCALLLSPSYRPSSGPWRLLLQQSSKIGGSPIGQSSPPVLTEWRPPRAVSRPPFPNWLFSPPFSYRRSPPTLHKKRDCSPILIRRGSLRSTSYRRSTHLYPIRGSFFFQFPSPRTLLPLRRRKF